MKTSALSYVCRLANELRYREGFTPSDAMTRAWKVYRLKEALRAGTVEFSYIKKDGTVRPAVGTITPVETPSSAPARNYSPLNIRYFDLDAGGYRQFAAARLVA